MSEEFQKLHEVILGNRHQISPKVTGTTYEDDLKSLQMFFAAHDGGLKQKLAITCYFRIWKYFFCKRGRITKAKVCILSPLYHAHPKKAFTGHLNNK